MSWLPDSEVSGCIGLVKRVIDDDLSFTIFLSPHEVKLITQESKTREVTETFLVDFIFNMRQYNGTDSVGWTGAGFLDKQLQYTGFTRYDENKGKIYADHTEFLGKKIKHKAELKEALTAYYSERFPEFKQAVDLLPEYVRRKVKKLLL